jgi:ketosteroid isomerase-like protein
MELGSAVPDWLSDLFEAIDRMDSGGFVQFLADYATFQFGNAQPVKGKENIRDAVAGFFSSIKGISHKLLGTWQVDDVVFLQGEVSYTRKDSRTVTIPFFNLFKMNGPLVSKYIIYIDVSPLYA